MGGFRVRGRGRSFTADGFEQARAQAGGRLLRRAQQGQLTRDARQGIAIVSGAGAPGAAPWGGKANSMRV